MTRRVTGTLYNPAGAAVASATLRFVALATATAGVPQGVSASALTNEAGVYDVTLLPGYYAVHLQRGIASTLLGRAAVASGSQITLPGLLAAADVPEPTAVELTARVEALEQIPPGSGIASVVAGDGIDVDNSDPLNPIVSATGGGGGAVTSVNGETGAVTLSAADVGADPAGSAATAAAAAAAALTAHEGAANPHPTYLTAAEGAAAFDSLGAAAAAVAAHAAAGDPHPAYLTAAEGNAAYDALGAAAAATSTAAAALTAHEAASNPHPTYLTAAEGNAAYDAIGAAATAASGAASALAAHVAAGDPHPGYLTAAEGNAAYDALGAAAAVAGDLAAHEAETTGAHGLPDPATLVTSATFNSIEEVTEYPDPEVAGVLYILVPA